MVINEKVMMNIPALMIVHTLARDPDLSNRAKTLCDHEIRFNTKIFVKKHSFIRQNL